MKKHNTKQIIISAIAFVISFIIAKFAVEYFINRNNTFDKQLMKAASDLNKSCPVMVDKDTRLDNTVALPDNIFQYNYTLVNYSKEEIDIDLIKNNLQPLLLNNIKSNDDLKIFRDNKVTLKYSYKE